MTDQTQTALITGATSGIGLELAKLFAKDNYNLVLVARKKADLNKVASDLKQNSDLKVTVIPADLSDSAAAARVFKTTQLQKIEIDVLVNNAGYGLKSPLIDAKLEGQQDMMRVNMEAVVSLTRLYLRAMKKRSRGRILNVASIAAYLPGPDMAVYYATKAFVLSFSQAIAVELKETGVTVTALCPGPTRTGFEYRATATDSRLFKNAASAESVARKGYRALMHGKPVIITGGTNKILAFLTRLVPGRVAARIARSFNN